ncbi:MAG: hypothetical protein LBH54_04680 [Clostridiales bacterium]|jgi:hypothetical protein|nr:hypothetical protein [Clostridiales bacterium]
MKLLKRFTVLLAVAVLCGGAAVRAYELPNAFWAMNDEYIRAVEARDNEKIIDSAARLIALIENEPESGQINEIMGSRLDQMGLAYERTGDFAAAGRCYQRYLPYARACGWTDGVKIAEAKALQYASEISVYTAEKQSGGGVLFGSNFDGQARREVPGESMVLAYLEFGEPDLTWIPQVLEDAQAQGAAVELALNLPGEGTQLASVRQSGAYIARLLDITAAHDTDVFLRFAAEVNVWTRAADPEEFIDAFRFVADLARARTANTKMVWSVNQVSRWGVDMNDYYPGDAYVDYVGVSCYMRRYFLGRNDWSEEERFNEVVFLAGHSADPARALREVVSRYGERKPIIIAEGGASHYSAALREDTTEWAIAKLRRLYWYVPMVYPQVKLIAYFDRTMAGEADDFSLSSAPRMAAAYRELTEADHFKGAVRYQRLDDTPEIQQKPQTLYAYVHVYGHDALTADYFVDGAAAGSASEVPFGVQIDFGKYPLGAHTLRVAVKDGGGNVLYEKTYGVTITERGVTVTLGGKELLFDTAPLLVNGRTLVPMRAIYEALGARVEWDDATQTVTARRGGTVITMRIGDYVITKNGAPIVLDVAPNLYGDRTLAPVRAVSETLDAAVGWDDALRKVSITP